MIATPADMDEELRRFARNPLNIRLNKELLECFERNAKRQPKRASDRDSGGRRSSRFARSR